MRHDQYLDIPGEILENLPYDPGIFSDPPSRDIQHWDLEETNSIERAFAKRSQLCRELGLEEDEGIILKCLNQSLKK